MIIGKLDRKLKLYTQTYSTNAYGERVVANNTFVTIYGDFDFKGGNTSFDADDLINAERIECLIRYRTNIGVSPQYFIANGSTNYSIKSIKEVGRKDAMILTLEKNDVIDLSVVVPAVTEFIFNVDTRITSTTTTAITDFKLPLTSSGTYDFNVDWGDNTNDNITTYNQSEVTHRYTTGGEYKITISGDCQKWEFNSLGDCVKMLDIENWGDLTINNPYAFKGCKNMTCSATDSPTILGVTLYGTFRDCFSFNGDLSAWDVSSIIIFSQMFFNCVSFNKSLNNWDTRSMQTMDYILYNCNQYNQDMDNWDTSRCTNMSTALMSCSNFNGNVSTWNTQFVTNMSQLFRSCYPINQDLSGWKIGAVTQAVNFMSTIDGLSTANYDALLISWSQQTPNSLSINFGGSKYTGGGTAEAARNTLINTYGWTIIDGGTA